MKKINETIKNMKPNKAAGPDETLLNFFKKIEVSLKQKILQLIIKVWKQEKIPCERPGGMLCALHIKWDTKQCSNYGGKSLLNITYKKFAILLCNRLCKIIESEIGNYQMGCRPNRSTLDNIFIVRKMHEKFHEYNIDLHNAFIDFSKVFDTFNRYVIHNSVIQQKVPHKLIKLLKLTMQRTKMKMKFNNSYPEWF